MTNDHTVLFDPRTGCTITLVPRRTNTGMDASRYTRIYMDNVEADARVFMLHLDIPDCGAPGYNAAVDAFNRAYRAACLSYARETTHGPDLKMRYSRTAGCACGCSPGIVTNSHMIDETTGRVLDVHIKVLGFEEMPEDDDFDGNEE